MALPLSCLQRLLCGIAPVLFTALAVWFCVYLMYCDWVCHDPVYSGCCVVLLISYVKRLLCGVAPLLFTAFAVWSCPCPVHSDCRAALPLTCCLSYVQRLLCDIAPILFTALAVRNCFYLMYSRCCVALPLSCLQRLLCGFVFILSAAVALWPCPGRTLTYNFLFP